METGGRSFGESAGTECCGIANHYRITGDWCVAGNKGVACDEAIASGDSFTGSLANNYTIS